MEAKLSATEQQISKVEKDIEKVQENLETCVEADKMYWRDEIKQLREKEGHLRKKEEQLMEFLLRSTGLNHIVKLSLFLILRNIYIYIGSNHHFYHFFLYKIIAQPLKYFSPCRRYFYKPK